jgi:hypothetical protein
VKGSRGVNSGYDARFRNLGHSHSIARLYYRRSLEGALSALGGNRTDGFELKIDVLTDQPADMSAAWRNERCAALCSRLLRKVIQWLWVNLPDGLLKTRQESARTGNGYGPTAGTSKNAHAD